MILPEVLLISIITMLSRSFPKAHSCKFCQKLVLEGESQFRQQEGNASFIPSQRVKTWLETHLKQFSGIDDLDRINFDAMVFDCTVAEMREAATGGCSLSVLLLSGTTPDKQEDMRDSFLAAKIHNEEVFFGVAIVLLSSHYDSDYSGRRKAKPLYDVTLNRPFEGASDGRFQLIAAADNAASREISTRPFNISPASEKSFDLARDWLRTCLETHQACRKPEETFMPTRLVEIVYQGEHMYLRLYEPASMSETRAEPYAALSYCWGGEQEVTTNSATLQRYRTKIDLQELPLTLKDAIFVVAKLGIRLIWIDALCIVQDDIYHRTVEIAQMPLVYSQATVTIAASRASKVQEGFLHERDDIKTENPASVFELPYRCSSGEYGSVMALPPIKESSEPLDDRAWTLQERLLSSRILEYGNLQMRWICHHNQGRKALSDGFKENCALGDGRSEDIFARVSTILSSEDQITSADRDYEKLLRVWYELVRVYTHRNLTLPTDRILAISGIASRFGGFLQDDYCAGLWRSDLHTYLSWKVNLKSELMQRPTQYQGPSWSWTAIANPVEFRSSGGPMDSTTDLLDCTIKLQTQSVKSSNFAAIYGAVEAGWLTIKGRLRPAKWLRSEDMFRSYQYNSIIYLDSAGQDDTLLVQMYADALEEKFANSEAVAIPVFLLIIALRIMEDWKWGLVLRRVNDTQYSRLGVFELAEYSSPRTDEKRNMSPRAHYQTHLDWFNEGDPQVITII